jgi:hypothetical protein
MFPLSSLECNADMRSKKLILIRFKVIVKARKN